MTYQELKDKFPWAQNELKLQRAYAEAHANNLETEENIKKIYIRLAGRIVEIIDNPAGLIPGTKIVDPEKMASLPLNKRKVRK